MLKSRDVKLVRLDKNCIPKSVMDLQSLKPRVVSALKFDNELNTPSSVISLQFDKDRDVSEVKTDSECKSTSVMSMVR